jgi:Co/Zn/Cd efflux system component
VDTNKSDAHKVGKAYLKKTLLFVAVLNLVGFFFEVGLAAVIGAVSLFADSVDFLEDASLNLLVVLALGWSVAWRRRLGIVLAGLLLVPAAAALIVAGQRVGVALGYDVLGYGVETSSGLAVPPSGSLLTLGGIGALAVNAIAAWTLVRVRHHGGGLVRAAYLSARNDVISNIAIIAAGMATMVTVSIWPDVIVGLIIIAINADAARDVYQAALREEKDRVTGSDAVP